MSFSSKFKTNYIIANRYISDTLMSNCITFGNSISLKSIRKTCTFKYSLEAKINTYYNRVLTYVLLKVYRHNRGWFEN